MVVPDQPEPAQRLGNRQLMSMSLLELKAFSKPAVRLVLLSQGVGHLAAVVERGCQPTPIVHSALEGDRLTKNGRGN
jgi:hypothetical protein